MPPADTLPPDATAPRRGRTVLLFRTGLGFVYLAAFLSLAVQIVDLAGSRGLLPVADHLARLRAADATAIERIHAFPTLHWITSSDTSLRLSAVGGAALSLALILGVGGRAVPLLLFMLYLSGVTAGRDFFYYQWDNLLLEAGALAIFLPARGTLADFARGRSLPEPSPVIVFLLRWLLFRLLFESGLAKLLFGREDWLVLNGMTFYYETAPLPSWGGWLVQQLPGWFHRLSIYFMLLVEVPLPFFAFGPRPFRRVLFLAHLPFQIAIAATSNYGWFSLLTLVLSLLLLDDRDLDAFASMMRRWVRLPTPAPGPEERARRLPIATSLRTRVSRLAPWILAGLLIPATLIEGGSFFLRGAGAFAAFEPVRKLYRPFRMVNRYHLFPGIVRRRVVRGIEGTADGRTWLPYYLRHAPGDPRAAPPTTWLHNPRFPFHYSFVTLRRGNRDAEYTANLVKRLCCNPEAVGDLFDVNPFPGPGPAALRVRDDHYRFGTRQDLASTGRYWIREPLGQPSRALTCSCGPGG